MFTRNKAGSKPGKAAGKQTENDVTQTGEAVMSEPLFDGAAADNRSDAVLADSASTFASEASEEGERFPAPRAFSIVADEVPVREEDRCGIDGLSADEDGAFEPEGDEFLQDAQSIIDDSQTDYYEYGDKMHGVREDIIAPEPPEGKVSRARHRKLSKREERKQHEETLPEHERRSHKTRRILTVVIIILVILVLLLVLGGFQLVRINQEIAIQQINRTQPAASPNADVSENAATQNQKVTEAPVLTSLIGKTQDEAVADLGHGAVASSTPVTDDGGNETGTSVTVMLTDEPSDTTSHTTPTVYLKLDTDGIITHAGYSAATASLGYGSLSFRDAVVNEHLVEKTLNAVGLVVDNGSVELPKDSSYATYATDGKTLVTEKCSFEGTSTVNSVSYEWSAILSYDYNAANASGNLADTIRQITVYISQA